MIWTFAFETCHGRGALNRFSVVLILIETRAILIMKVSPDVNNFMRWVFNFFLPILDFFSHGISVCVCVFSSHSFWTSSSLDVPCDV